MSPNLEPGDGFIAVPIQLAGPIEPGDVVAFDAKVLHGGGLTTHRVVDETAAGFITKGDANAVTDQDGSEPPVKRGQDVAVAYQFGGTVVSTPSPHSASPSWRSPSSAGGRFEWILAAGYHSPCGSANGSDSTTRTA